MAYLTLPPEFIPEVSTVINWVMSFTPLISYGTTALSIRKHKSTQGFSLDICATMLISSSLRIFYYFNDPFEISLLRQCFIMIFIQTILLRNALKFRTVETAPLNLEIYDINWVELRERFLEINKVLILEDIEEATNGELDYKIVQAVLISLLKALKRNLLLILYALYEVIAKIVSFFDAHYLRPFQFWQWEAPSTYWKFLLGYVAALSFIQLCFHRYEHLGIMFGSASFMVESSLPLPQILLFRRLQTVEGFKTILLLSWLGGDFTKLSYLLYGTDNVGWIFIIAAIFQMSLNLFITYQFFYYKRMDIKREQGDVLPMTILNRPRTTSSVSIPSIPLSRAGSIIASAPKISPDQANRSKSFLDSLNSSPHNFMTPVPLDYKRSRSSTVNEHDSVFVGGSRRPPLSSTMETDITDL